MGLIVMSAFSALMLSYAAWVSGILTLRIFADHHAWSM
jgi:hypothetical protein